MRKTWEHASNAPKTNVQDDGVVDGRRVKGRAMNSLLLPKNGGVGAPSHQ